MRPNDMGIPDVQALVRFGQLGMRLFAARLLTFSALVGFFTLAGFVAYKPSYVGAAVVVVALFVFRAALQTEETREPPEG